jgi:2-methylisocitrate lyase-like PEP mutase family enzyme
MRRTARFRQLIDAPEILVLPGAHDALSLKLIQRAGFHAAACGGYSATASLIGQPDVAQLAMNEMAEMYARLCDSCDLPLLADADTGYGGPTNVARTVRAYERAGVAALFIEDQVSPKRCGHMEGKQVIPAAEMVEKLKAALDSRIDDQMIIMARTDARAMEGIEAAIDRAELYRETGADLLFVEAPQSLDELRRICSEIAGPCLANNVEGGKTPVLAAPMLEELGFAAVTWPVSATYAVAHALSELYALLKRDGTTAAFANDMLNFDSFNELIGLPALRAREAYWQEEAQELVDGFAERAERD